MRTSPPRLVGSSACIRELLDMAGRVAGTDASVLILGESGTGKERLARLLHDRSARANGPFVICDCAALPPSLIESELFGHARGAFTGAVRERSGLFREANGGTILIDEIGDLDAPLQSKLLRVLQERHIRPVGSDELFDIDVRVIAATNRPLKELSKAGEFRRDLYFRLAVVVLRVPPLRDRLEDLAELTEDILNRSVETERPPHLTDAALAVLAGHSWPGNVRELENVVTRAAILCDGVAVGPDNLPALEEEEQEDPQLSSLALRAGTDRSLPEIVKEATRLIETRAIREALLRTRGSPTEAAKMLGLSRASIYAKMSQYGISRDEK